MKPYQPRFRAWLHSQGLPEDLPMDNPRMPPMYQFLLWVQSHQREFNRHFGEEVVPTISRPEEWTDFLWIKAKAQRARVNAGQLQ